jgi:1-phosphofructokinase
MVITVTLNPAMDKTLIVDNFKTGEVNRVSSLRYDIGGKGINVSKVLKNFGIDSVSTGFLGGIWENSFKEDLSKRGIQQDFIHVEGNTRTNTKIVDSVNNVFTDVNEPGPEIKEADMNSFLEKFSSLCNEGDIVVLSGNVSATIPVTIYGTLTKLAKAKGALVILDADGVLLAEGIKELPHIIKPNEHELAKLLNIDGNNKDEILKAALKLQASGIEKLMISMGSKGGMYVTSEGVYYAEGLKVPVKSTVGAGDTMVAGLIYSLINKFDPEKTLKFATACGAAAVTLPGTTACSLEEANSYFDKVKVTKI